MSAPSPPPRETILLVDDEQQVLAFIEELLRADGYLVVTTWDPDEALRIARAHVEPLHLLLTDLVMPFMTGQELAEEVRASHPDVKVLFMSAYSMAMAEDYKVRLSPGEPYLTKPFTIGELRQAVRAAIEYTAPSPAHRTL